MKNKLLIVLAVLIVIVAVGLLSDERISFIRANYSILIGWITSLSYPAMVRIILKGIAILNPNVKTDTIRELLTPNVTEVK